MDEQFPDRAVAIPPAGSEMPDAPRSGGLSPQLELQNRCRALRLLPAMLTSQRILDAINEQIGCEYSAMLQYVAIAAHFDNETLPELAAHFSKQAEEEKEHALRFVKYVTDTGGCVRIPAIDAPQSSFKTAEEAVQLSLDQEKKVTAQINNLVHMAKEESDYTTDNFLQWFVQEQLEEVSSMADLLAVVQRAGEENLLRVEEYLGRKGGRSLSAGIVGGGD
jgi:ferritin